MSTAAVSAALVAPARASRLTRRRGVATAKPRAAALRVRAMAGGDASGMKVIVVGGSGFVGSRVCEKLTAAGVADVVVV